MEGKEKWPKTKEFWKEYRLDLLFYLLTILYPNYIIISYKTKRVMDANLAFFECIHMKKFIVDNKGVFDIFFLASIFLVPGIAFFLKKKFEKSPLKEENQSLRAQKEIYGKILATLGDVVEHKRKRFRDYLEKLKKNKDDGTKIFETITQPVAQIIKIFDGINYIFSSICNNDKIKVSIIKCWDGKLNNYFYHSDDKPNTTVEELQKHKSTARQTLLKKEIQLISNTSEAKNKQWYYSKNSNNKSIICYPITVGKQVEFIISITSKRGNDFQEKDVGKFNLILSELGSRIILESYLDQIKETKNEQKTS